MKKVTKFLVIVALVLGFSLVTSSSQASAKNVIPASLRGHWYLFHRDTKQSDQIVLTKYCLSTKFIGDKQWRVYSGTKYVKPSKTYELTVTKLKNRFYRLKYGNDAIILKRINFYWRGKAYPMLKSYDPYSHFGGLWTNVEL